MNPEIRNQSSSVELFQALSEQDSQHIQGGLGISASRMTAGNLKTFRIEGDPDRPLVSGMRFHGRH